jgi:threonine dehydratase
VAAIASQLGVQATIVMPESASPIKIQNTKSWGASVVLRGRNYDEAFEYAQLLAEEKGYLLIHPYRDPLVMAGQGTLGLEMLEDPCFAGVEAVAIAIGGGGLVTGVAEALRSRRPDLKIYGITARQAPAVWKSFHSKTAVAQTVAPTLADGIAIGKTDPGMLQHLLSLVDEIFSLSEESIAQAIAVLAERAKLVVEGAGALPVAALIENLIPEKRVAVVLCGGNIDIPTFAHVLQRGLVEQGRLVRLSIRVPDKPGGLNAITEVLAKQGANVLQVFHQRASLQYALGETEVEVEFETKGREHTEEIIAALHDSGLQVARD